MLQRESLVKLLNCESLNLSDILLCDWIFVSLFRNLWGVEDLSGSGMENTFFTNRLPGWAAETSLHPPFQFFSCFLFPGNNISFFLLHSLLSRTAVKPCSVPFIQGKGFNSRDWSWWFQDAYDSCLLYTTSWRFSVAGRLSASGRFLLLKSNSPQQTVDLAIIFLSVSHPGFLLCNCWVGFLRVWLFPPILFHPLILFSFAL